MPYPTVDLADPRVRTAMRALMTTGHYEETEDAFEWLSGEAQDCVFYAIDGDFPDPVSEVYCTLANTGLHDITDPAEAACLRRDAEAVVRALHNAAVQP